MMDMVIFVVAMESLCFSSRTDLHGQTYSDDCFARIGVQLFAVVVAGGLVYKFGSESGHQGVDEPVFSGCFAAGYHASAAAGFWREEIAFPGFVFFYVGSCFFIDGIDDRGACEVFDYGTAVFLDTFYDLVCF